MENEKRVYPRDICKLENSGRATILQYPLFTFLHQHGFYSYRSVDSSLKVYKVERGIAKVVDKSEIYNFINDNVFRRKTKTGIPKCDYPRHMELFLRSWTSIVNDSKMSLLPKMEMKLLRDNKTEGFFFFQDGVVRVRRGSIMKLDMQEAITDGGIILEDKIIPRDITIVSKETAMASDFGLFAIRAVGHEGFPALKKALGYMMHTFKDKANAKMVFFSDANTNFGVANGRTGKSLCSMDALKQVRNLVVIDGKQFDTQDRFLLDNVDITTDIICFQDMKQKFDSNYLYNMITGELQVGKKYQNKEVIPFEISPKLIADSNYGINLLGGSDLARFVVIGFDNYYNEKHQPLKEFKRRFFDWDTTEWNKFYSFMFYCMQEYLNDGVRDHRLQELMTNNIYSRYDAELIDQLKENLAVLTVPNDSDTIFNHVTYWGDDSISSHKKLNVVKEIMRELGYVKMSRRDSLRTKDEKGNYVIIGSMKHWFENK